MDRFTRLGLWCLTLFLVLFTLAVGKPGLPPTFKADEPAYYLMALSLALDGDLRCDLGDVRRAWDEYPYMDVRNLIVMTDDGWQTVYFGKPYIYSLFAAPLAARFGANGLVAVNMLLLMGLIWMGTVYLSRFNGAGLAALFSCGFFLLSNAFAYVFWLQPELFNMASVMAGLFFAFHRFDAAPAVNRLARLRSLLFAEPWLPAWSGAAFAFGVYNKPMFAAMALPAAWIFWRRRGLRGVATLALAAALTLGVISGISWGFTGHPSAYLGVARVGYSVHGPDEMPVYPMTEEQRAEADPERNSWTWMFRIPEFQSSRLLEDVRYFFVGRHTGLFLYTPFALVALVLFLLHGRRSGDRWLVLASLTLVAAVFLLWIPFNWHGGGGFVGNRYFVNVYPGFLFLVTRIRPAWINAAGYAVAGLLLGPIIFTPFGAPVPEPTLQAHVRGGPYRYFPLELSIINGIPGYRGVVQSEVWFQARKDVFRPRDDELWLHGATPVELWAHSAVPLEALVFEVRNLAPGNRLEIDYEGGRQVMEFPERPEGIGEIRRLVVTPSEPSRVRLGTDGGTIWVYRMLFQAATGQVPALRRDGRQDGFYLGAALTYLGTPSDLERSMWEVEWGVPRAPATVPPGESFRVTSRVFNRSDETWPSTGATRVHLSYHWLDENGEVFDWEGRRTGLRRDIAPGQAATANQEVVAPDRPGSYILSLDLVRENVAWFSERNEGETLDIPVEVAAPTDETASESGP